MRELSVEGTGVKLHCRMYGEDDVRSAQTVLLIHGAMVDSDFFSYTAELLARRYRVVTYDRRGYGGADAPADGAYEIDAQADDAAAVILAVGGPCLVVGHSAGAIVAMALVARHPELVSACVLDEPPLKELAVPTDPAVVNLDLATEAIAAGRYAHAKVLFVDIMSRHDDRALPRTEAELVRLNDYFNHFIRHEFVPVFAYHPDYEALSRAKLALMLGDQSLDTYIAGIVETLSRRVDAPVFYRPGAHNGARDLPADYAHTVVGTFELGW